MAEPSRSSKVLALSMGHTLSAIGGLISGSITARVLSKMDYATMKQTLLSYEFIAPLIFLGLPTALYYFLPRNEDRQRGVTMDNILLLIILAVLFSLFLALGGYHLLANRFNNPTLDITLKWMIPYPLFAMPASVLAAVLVTKGKTMTLTVYNVVSSFVMFGAIITGVLYTRSYSGPLIAQIALPALFCTVALFLIFNNLPIGSLKPNIASMKEILWYSAPLGIATMLGTFMIQLDKVIVSVMCTPVEFANYVNGAVEIPLISIITGSISTIILADMSKYVQQNQKSEALELFRKSAVYSASILFPAMIFLIFNAKSIIVTLYSEKYIESIAPFIIFLFILPVRTVVYGSALMALGKTKIVLVRSLFDLLVNIALSILFVYLWGYLGAAIATITTLYVWHVPFNLYHIGKGFEVSPWKTMPFKKMMEVMFISVAGIFTGLIYELIPSTFLIVQIIVDAILYFPLVFYILYRRNFLPVPVMIENMIPKFMRK